MSKRHLFSALFIALFALIIGIFGSLGFTPTSSAQQIVTATFTNTPQFIGTLIEPSPTFEFCLEPLDLFENDIIRVNPGVIIRSQPTASSALLANFEDPVAMRIIGDVVCQGGFNWWPVTGQDVTGWVSEGRRDRYWISLVEAADDRVVECFEPLSLAEGERFDILYNVRIRNEPTILSLTQTVVDAGNQVIILEGPVCADGYNWWKVRATVVDIVYDGWMAEGSRFGKDYIEEPPEGDGTICRTPQNFVIGDRAKVTYNDGTPKRLRAAPNLNATVLYDLVKNVPLEIVGGPVCAATYNWWQVRVLGSVEVVGWLAEGGPANYWINVNR